MKSGILLGHIVSKEGLSIDPDKVKAIQEMKQPGSPKELERFMEPRPKRLEQDDTGP